MNKEQAVEIIKKYDSKFYEYYINNAHAVSGLSLINYAEYLLSGVDKTR